MRASTTGVPNNANRREDFVVGIGYDDAIDEAQEIARGVLADLAPPVPGSLLYWLNGRQHPDIVYVAVVRGAAYGLPGDQVVPAPSQDLRRVPGLNGRATIRVVAGGHERSLQDALLLSEPVSRPANATATASK